MSSALILFQRVMLPLGLFAAIAFEAAIGRLRGPAAIGERLRRTFERLQVTYLKLGQYLAIRVDLFPSELCRELEKLFDDVAPLDYSVAVAEIVSELGRSVDEVFATFERKPIAAASIAQVHRVTLHDGRVVAVNILRSGIREIFAADTRVIWLLARVIDLIGILPLVKLSRAAAEFDTFTTREMDFRQEATTAIRIRAMRLEGCVIPDIIRKLSTSRVLVMDFIEGVSLAQIMRADRDEPAIRPPPELIGLALSNLARVTLRQLYVEGLCHADPHPGNVIIRPDGRVGLVDFGIFGETSPARTQRLRSYVWALVAGDFSASAWHPIQIGRAHV